MLEWPQEPQRRFQYAVVIRRLERVGVSGVLGVVRIPAMFEG